MPAVHILLNAHDLCYTSLKRLTVAYSISILNSFISWTPYSPTVADSPCLVDFGRVELPRDIKDIKRRSSRAVRTSACSVRAVGIDVGMWERCQMQAARATSMRTMTCMDDIHTRAIVLQREVNKCSNTRTPQVGASRRRNYFLVSPR